MKLLIITQKMDKSDPVLGFFHNWVLALSDKFESISVVCLSEGDIDLPQNTKVFSLGKTNMVASSNYLVSRIKYIFKFYNYLWKLRGGYDAVFVHMNQEYVLLGGLFWKFSGKKIFLWRNHPKGGLLTRVAVWFSEKVFCTSPQSFTARFNKTKIMPVGIDVSLFYQDNQVPVIPNSVLSIGRISPIKKIDKVIEAVLDLHQGGTKFVLDVIGDPVNQEDYKYQEILVEKSKELTEDGSINFISAISQKGAALMFKSHNIFINLTPSGSMDKTILEAVACGCLPIVANKFFADIFLPKMIVGENIDSLPDKIKFWLEADRVYIREVLEKLQKYVLENHSLNALMKELIKEISNV